MGKAPKTRVFMGVLLGGRWPAECRQEIQIGSSTIVLEDYCSICVLINGEMNPPPDSTGGDVHVDRDRDETRVRRAAWLQRSLAVGLHALSTVQPANDHRGTPADLDTNVDDKLYHLDVDGEHHVHDDHDHDAHDDRLDDEHVDGDRHDDDDNSLATAACVASGESTTWLPTNAKRVARHRLRRRIRGRHDPHGRHW